jgi:hypothetical protein
MTETILSFFPEVISSETCGRLILTLVADTYDDKKNYRHNVGKHIDKRLKGGVYGKCRADRQQTSEEV